jgi:hypothetical protein
MPMVQRESVMEVEVELRKASMYCKQMRVK